MRRILSRGSMLFSFAVISLGIVFFFTQSYSNDAFGIEENFVTLQTGIISTENRDFAVSNEFEIRILKNGNIMRLSGVATTGEPYYIYQKNIDDDVILKGKILVEGKFVSIIHKEVIPETQISLEPNTELIMSIKLPHNTYAGYPVIISVKVFDAELNPQAKYDQSDGALEDVFVNVTITNEIDEIITSLSGNTDLTGVFRDRHVVREGIDVPGEYTVNVLIDDGTTSISQSYTTFFRGDIRDYWESR